MTNLIKMDMRRLLHAKVFLVSLIIIGGLNILVQAGAPLMAHYLMHDQAEVQQKLSQLIATPFSTPIHWVVMFISVVSFSYADMANGFVKNIAGQISRKSDTVVSKFIIVGIHNLILMLFSSLVSIAATLVPVGMGMETFVVDGQLGAAIPTFLLKWMLSMAICAILVFFTTAVKNKTVATIAAVCLGTGAIGGLYFVMNMAAKNFLHLNNFDLSNFVPDQLISTVSVGEHQLVLNAILVALVWSAAFIILTVKLFNARDIK